MEELVEVTVLMEGLMPYGGYTPVIAAVWDTHAAGSIGRIGSPAQLNVGYAVMVDESIKTKVNSYRQKQVCVSTGIYFTVNEGKQKQWDKHSLLGRAKQLRGFGSQHFATVSVIGLEIMGDREKVEF